MRYKSHFQGQPVLHIFAVVGILLKNVACSVDVVSVFHQPPDSGSRLLRNFLLDSRDGSLYVGGVNVVYRLADNLQQYATVSLGPHRDIVDCAHTSGLSLNCTLAAAASDSYTQAIVLDVDSDVIILCGTLYYGSCARVSIADFATAEYIYDSVVPNDESKSAAVVIAPGFTGGNLLYVGAAYSARGDATVRNSFRLFSVRDLHTFELASVETTSSSSVQIRPEFQADFAMHFVRAYYFNDHVYFFFRRPPSLASGDITSHVLRICTNDNRMHSVVELPLQCSVNNVNYPYMRDISLINFDRSTSEMQDASSLTGPALVGVFTNTAEGAGNSALCIFYMTGPSSIEATFQTVIQNCFDGHGSKGPEYIVAPEKCTGVVSCF